MSWLICHLDCPMVKSFLRSQGWQSATRVFNPSLLCWMQALSVVVNYFTSTCFRSLCWSHSRGCTGPGARKENGWPSRSFLAVAALIWSHQKPAMTGKNPIFFLKMCTGSMHRKVKWWDYVEQHPAARLFTLLYCYLTQFTEVDDTFQTSKKCSLQP